MPHTVQTSTRQQQQTRETFLPPQKITAFENLNRALDDPFSGTGIQNVIQALLESLVPGEEAARRTQADQFRRAGAISDASRAVAGAQLETGLQRGRATTAAEGFLRFLQPLLQGRAAALSGIPALSRAQGTSSAETFRPGLHPSDPSAGVTRRAALQRPGGGAGVTGGARTGAERDISSFGRFADPSAVAFGPGAGLPSTFTEVGERSFAQVPPLDSGGDGLVREGDSVIGISPNISPEQFDRFVNENFFG